MPGILVDGIVAMRDKQPYLRLFKDREQIAQFSMAEARNIAHDILTMCARAEADAMILKFFAARELPEGAAAALLVDFREYRATLDREPVGKFQVDPDTAAPV
jgi:hypothetical protein